MPFDVEKTQDIFERLAAELNYLEVPATWYKIDSHDGYSSITGKLSHEVYCLEADLGMTKNGRTFAFAQIFWDKYPNLVVIGMLVRAETGEVLPVEALYNLKVDAIFSKIFLPLVFRGFNSLDPGGKLHGQVVMSYMKTRVLFEDLLPAIGYTLQLVTNRSWFGQYAIIGVDFGDALTRFIAWLMNPIAKANHLYVFPETKEISAIRIPVRNTAEPFELVSSKALDAGFAIAIQHLQGDKFDTD